MTAAERQWCAAHGSHRMFFGVGAARFQQILLVISDVCVHQNLLSLR